MKHIHSYPKVYSLGHPAIAELEGADRDIGKLIKEVQRDIGEECRDEISDALLKWALPKVKRGASGGVAEWYKRRLAEKQFTSVVPKPVGEQALGGDE